MTSTIRVASLNLCAYWRPEHHSIENLAALIAEQEPDIVLLQECRDGWLQSVCEVAGLDDGVWSQSIEPQHGFPKDGTAIAVRGSLKIERTWRISPEKFAIEEITKQIDEVTPEGFEQLPERLGWRYSARTLLAELSLDGQRFVAASFHGTPGTSEVEKGQKVDAWKTYFPAAAAIEMASVDLPFVFGIDANEPEGETETSASFHFPDNRRIEALLGYDEDKRLHRGRDLLRRHIETKGLEPAAPDLLIQTYETKGGAKRRFDSMWATPEFELEEFSTLYREALNAGTDHALLIVDVSLS